MQAINLFYLTLKSNDIIICKNPFKSNKKICKRVKESYDLDCSDIAKISKVFYSFKIEF